MHKILMMALTLPVFLLASDNEFFKSNYDDARAQFKHLSALQANRQGFSLQQSEFPDPQDSQLTTDITWVRPVKPNDNLIIVLSGLHGIEGFAGSAIQARLLKNLKPTMTSDYLFVHALNPYGFQNFRRVDRSNVDLNRNFHKNKFDFTKSNAAYQKLDSFLNPTQPAQLSFFSRLGFGFSSLKLILQYSVDSVRQSILVGQHQFPKGLYFGGLDHQYQKQIIDQLYENIFKNYTKIFVVDLHTGYGQKNKLHILANSKAQPSAADLTRIFPNGRINFGDQKNFYKVSGDLVSYLEAKSTQTQKIWAVVFEYGTLDSQNLSGSIESLRRMVLENQKVQFGTKETLPLNTRTTANEIDDLFKEMFYPENQSWRRGVLLQSDIEFEKIKLFLQNK